MFRRHLAVPVGLAAALMLPEMAGPISRVAAHPHNLLLITLDTMRVGEIARPARQAATDPAPQGPCVTRHQAFERLPVTVTHPLDQLER